MGKVLFLGQTAVSAKLKYGAFFTEINLLEERPYMSVFVISQSLFLTFQNGRVDLEGGNGGSAINHFPFQVWKKQ